MDTYSFPAKTKKTILALGAESDGNFCFFEAGKIHFSESFGDLLEEKNWQKYQKAVLEFLKKNKFKPDAIITDLHPLYLTSAWGKGLSKKYKAQHIKIQHHFAHIFSIVGDKIINNPSYQMPKTFYGIAMDGTGYGEDGKIWGGEVFKIFNFQFSIFNEIKNSNKQILKPTIERIGHLENQTLIGGDLAIKEPARMLISILDKALLPSPYQGEGLVVRSRGELKRKNAIYQYVKKYYPKNEFELIYSQLKQNFNCLETSSTGRILDAISLLLGFCGNERKYKHEPIALLEANSGKPYADLKPKIILSQGKQVLSTAFLFKYLVKNLHKDKKRLAATAQLYIAQGLWKIITGGKTELSSEAPELSSVFSGGIANNKIISEYLISKGACASNEIPRGDAGLSFGQIVYYLLSK